MTSLWFQHLARWVQPPGRPAAGFFANVLRRGAALAAVCCAVALLAGCRHVSIGGKPYLDQEAFATNPPRTIAILPTTDRSGHPDLADPMRKALARAISALPYQDREEDSISEYLSRTAAHLELTPSELPPGAMLDPQLADCVVFSEIEEVSRLYLILYAHFRLDLNLSIWDTRTRKLVYQNKFVFYDRVGIPTYDIMGLFGSSIISLWHLRPNQLEETLDEGTQKLAQELPKPRLELARNGPMALTDVQVVTPFKSLTTDAQVDVYAQGTPHGQASFSIGHIARRVPMTEESPGRYHGAWKVAAGSDRAYAVVEVTLAHADGRVKVDYVADKASFGIDTKAPPRAHVARWWPDAIRPGIHLDLELEDDASGNDEIPEEYVIYRQSVGGAKFDEVGVSHDKTFYDWSANTDGAYEYYVVTRDRAGNSSPVGPVTRVTPAAQ